MDSDRTAQALDIARRAAVFLTVHEVTALAPDVRVLDPGSVLIGGRFRPARRRAAPVHDPGDP